VSTGNRHAEQTQKSLAARIAEMGQLKEAYEQQVVEQWGLYTQEFNDAKDVEEVRKRIGQSMAA
jgi:hypothetical protein